MGIWMIDSLHALLGTIAEEIYGVLIEKVLIGFCCHDIGTNLSDGF